MREAPYYESRYIRANHPERPLALWLRETLLLPTAGDPVADVWVMVFDPEGEGNRALKQPYPIDAADRSSIDVAPMRAVQVSYS